MKFIGKIINFLENSPLSFRTWLVSFGTLMALRLLIENILFNFLKSQPFGTLISFFVHTLFFFLFLYLVLTVFLRLITKERIKKIASLLLWGYWIMLLPPILDRIIFKGKDVWSFYYFGGMVELWKGFITFFGSNLSVGVTLGSRIMIALAIVLLAVYVFIKTNNYVKTVFSFIGFYLIFFIFGSFPSFITIFEKILEKNFFLAVNSLDVASVFLVPANFFSLAEQTSRISVVFRLNLVYGICIFLFLMFWQLAHNRVKFRALLGNVRYPQVIFNSGLFFLGMGLGWYYYPENFKAGFFEVLIVINLILVVFSAWFFSVFSNDINDIKIDKKTNQDRPLIKKVFLPNEYNDYGLVFLLFSLLVSAEINAKIFLLVACYHLLTFIYSCYPFRIKRFIPAASILSSFASMLFLVCGFILISTGQSLVKFPFQIGLLLFLSFFIIIPLKDLKDIDGDRDDGVFTLPVLVGIKNARLILATLLFFLYFFSVYLINEPKIFLSSLIFGSASFWAVSSDKFSIKNLNWWVLLFAALYGINIVKVIFLK